MKPFINKQTAWGAASVVLMLVLWKGVSVHYASEFILPSPEKTLKTALALFADGNFLQVAGATVLRGLIGFMVAIVLGIGLGIPAGMFSGFRSFITPVLVLIRSVPVVAFILLALIWFSSDTVPVFIGLLTMFPLVCTNVMEGIRQVDRNLVQMARFYRVSTRRIIWEVYLPAITPFLFSGFSNAIGIGWRAIIVGEVLSQPQYGIGTVMQTAQTYFNIDVLIAWTLLTVFISYLFERLVRGFEHLAVRWRDAV